MSATRAERRREERESPAAPGPFPKITFSGAMNTIFREWFSPAGNWEAWRVLVSAALGEPPPFPGAVDIYRRWTGRAAWPAAPCSELWIAAGRRSGKDWACAALCVFLACLRHHTLKAGEKGRVLLLAATKDQASETLRYVKGLIHSVPALAAMIVDEGKESVELNNGVEIRVTAANFRSIRGRKLLACVCTEIAFWYDSETSANPCDAILTAIRPSFLGVPGALLMCISSLWSRRGPLFATSRERWAKDDDEVMYWQSGTVVLHPGADVEAFIRREAAKDPVAAASEYGLLDGSIDFRRDLEDYVSIETVAACTMAGVASLPHEPGRSYRAFIDVSGGSGADSTVLVIAMRDGNRVVVVLVREWRPPFSPVDVAHEVAEIMRGYSLTSVKGDRYSGGTWPDILRRAGVSYDHEEKTSSDLLREHLLPMLNSGLVRLPDMQRLRNQLVNLERTRSKTGHDTVAAPRGQNDDLCVAVAGAAKAAQGRRMFEGEAQAHLRSVAARSAADPDAAEREREELRRRVEAERGQYVCSREGCGFRITTSLAPDRCERCGSGMRRMTDDEAAALIERSIREQREKRERDEREAAERRLRRQQEDELRALRAKQAVEAAERRRRLHDHMLLNSAEFRTPEEQRTCGPCGWGFSAQRGQAAPCPRCGAWSSP